MINSVRLEGALYETFNMSLKEYDMAQFATLVYNNGRSHIRVLGRPVLKVAFVACKPCIVEGTLHGDHIDVRSIEYK